MSTLLSENRLVRRIAVVRPPMPARHLPTRAQLRSASLRFALTSVPMVLVDTALATLARVMARRHPGLVARLAASAGAKILIEFSDAPCALLLVIEEAPKPPTLRLATGVDRKTATATVAGRVDRLMDLLDGRVDGDTMFFSRDLFIDGDTSAILLLRNALDSEEVDLFDDALDLLGPFSRPARRVRRHIAALAQGMERRRRPRPPRLRAAVVEGSGRNGEL
ncbi:MAG: SCP2 sterol-binding domain-containing protein [Alphaproteobacteria bacterium]|nr:SCP2 sterol-binding domain-containing protein [Alphaproteobacteria bacterium]